MQELATLAAAAQDLCHTQIVAGAVKDWPCGCAVRNAHGRTGILVLDALRQTQIEQATPAKCAGEAGNGQCRGGRGRVHTSNADSGDSFAGHFYPPGEIKGKGATPNGRPWAVLGG